MTLVKKGSAKRLIYLLMHLGKEDNNLTKFTFVATYVFTIILQEAIGIIAFMNFHIRPVD